MPSRPRSDRLRVVIFSGGRGSGVLSEPLIRDPRIQLTLAINGYDDGASTGEVRRFLGDALGPSDFRKNASRLAAALGTCDGGRLAVLDARLPAGATRADAEAAIARVAAPPLRERLDRFLAELTATRRPFEFADCSLGNLAFAGSFLLCGRDFNRAVDDYCALVGLPPGLIENVSDGRNAYLVGIDADGRVIPTEEELVDGTRAARVRDIFLVDERPDGDRLRQLEGAGDAERQRFFEEHSVAPSLNQRLAPKLAGADVIIYAPGTQHSSLFPSYLTAGLSRAIAANLGAIKLLVTNIQTDAEIAGSSAVDLIERAGYYLKEKGRLATPAPALITHYLLNDPAQSEPARPYVPLGQVERLEDPRLVRIANYEEGVSGRHDASRILTPFIESLLAPPARPRIAVLLHDAESPDKVAQTLVEMVRGGAADLAAEVTVFYALPAPLDGDFERSLPFRAVHLGEPREAERRFREALPDRFDYVLLFESSGMYRGEDMVSLASHLALGRLDAVWGSRRLSVRDISESYRLRYRHDPVMYVLSYAGSHLLSVAYLFLYGRYVADTLSAVRAVRAEDATALPVPLTHKQANHWLLARLLRRRADLLEVPVQFFPLSPERVRRTTVGEGVGALWTLVRERFRAHGGRPGANAAR